MPTWAIIIIIVVVAIPWIMWFGGKIVRDSVKYINIDLPEDPEEKKE